jgi:hypothetical protein
MSRILAVWVCSYYSGITSERFLNPLKALGYEVDVIDSQDPGAELNILRAIKKEEYDFLIHVPYRVVLRNEFIKYISDKFGINTIAWNGDDEWLIKGEYDWFKKNALSHDLNISTCEGALKKYKEIGSEVILGQWGYSKSDWRPKKCQKDIDVYFCGARSKERDKYIRAMMDAGIKLDIDGPEYSIHHPESKIKGPQGKLELKEMVNRLRRAKIGINFSTGVYNDLKFSQVKARNFEIPAVGTFQLTEDSKEIKRYFEDSEIDTFENEYELIEKIKFWLHNEEDRERIARNGYLRNKEYTYEKIFGRVFDEVFHHWNWRSWVGSK